MKKIAITIIIALIAALPLLSQNIVFSEDFEDITPPALPSGWTQEKVVGSTQIDWETLSGGHQGNPPSGYNGTAYNAIFQYQSYNGEATRLITPPMDLTEIIKPELRFGHIQDIWWDEQDWWDRLKVYYKRGEDSAWVLLEEYKSPVTEWTARDILLPDSSLSSTYYIGFEGITGYGHGVCIDEIQVVETGIIPKYINSISIKQTNSSFIPTGTDDNPVMRIDFDVEGNEGNLILDSLALKSLNTSDDDIDINGVKLYATKDTIFSTDDLRASGDFNSGVAVFNNLNYDLPRNNSSLWITYDIKEDVDHEMHGHIADLYIEKSSIKINDNLYPYVDKSPEKSRTIYESIFIDDFETDLNWRLKGEFERAIPQGLFGTNGSADPDTAYSGSYVLGTDLTDDGLYSSNMLDDSADVAQMPTLNLKYYKDIYLTYYRWLNVDFQAKARIFGSSNATDWTSLWASSGFFTEDSWNYKSINISNTFERQDTAMIKYTLGPTGTNQYTGWNIENVIIIGNYISKDVGITDWVAPLSGCGHNTSEEYVEVTIKNYAGDALNDPLPISYSFDGGTTILYDTIQNPNIPSDGSMSWEIDKPSDLSTPGWYNNVYATTHLAGDEDASNNRLNTSVFITPTYNLPYSENFETNYGYYITGGENSTWAYGEPDYVIIDTAASGTHAWVTNLTGLYANNDSSYLLSPCFNFSGSDSIILEFKCNASSEDKTDGMAIYYSIDDGLSWNLVPDDNDYYWNWYTEPLISELETPGIDSTDGNWLTFRQLLPSEVSNQSSVKFRFMFESNESNTYEGIGIDDVKIYEAPHDVGVTSLDYPFTACEWKDTTHVKVTIENFGITTLETGSKIPVALDFQGSYFTTDTLTLASPLIPGGTTQFTFNETVNMSDTGNYNFDVYTLLESNPYFYNKTVCNDTISDTIRVDGMPNYDIGWIVGSDDLDTLLDAGIFQGVPYDSYLWHGPVEDSTTQTYRASAAGIYYITVSRTNELYCEAYDSLKVVPSTIDVKMDSILTELDDSCERFELTEIKVTISNQGQELVSSNPDSIPFGYQINDLPEVYDTLILTRNLTTATDPATDTINFTFKDKCNLTEIGEYTIRVFTNFAQDLNRLNDNDTITINTFGMPDVELAHDTIYSSQADTLTLDAGAGFASYSWNSGSTSQTETPPSNSSYYYKVTVTDTHSCGTDKDSTYIETHDLGISDVTSPVNICFDDVSGSVNLNVDVTNYSDSVYSSSTQTIYYEYDGSGPVEVNPSISVGASGTSNITIGSLDVSAIQEHVLKVYTSSNIDANHSNDTIEYTFNTWPEPNVDLAYDTIFTTKADTVVLVAQEGYAGYAWSDGLTFNDSLVVSDKTSKKYIVTVTDVHCGTATDSTQIITYDLGVLDLVTPRSGCENSSSETVRITVKNYGKDIIPDNTIIPIGFIFNGSQYVNENYQINGDLNPGQTVFCDFTEKVDMSGAGDYSFKLYTDFDLDVKQSNDTLVDVLKTFGYPTVDLGDDIYTTDPTSVVITAPGGYNFYKWNNDSTSQSLEVKYPATALYSVTVTDINGCNADDSVTVYTYDIGITSINSPESSCVLGSAETVDITVLNNSQDTLLTGESIDLSYSLDGGTDITEAYVLTSNLLPDSTFDYTFTASVDISSGTDHIIKATTARTIDVNDVNDTLSVHVSAVGYPSFDLGNDIYTTNPVGTVIHGPTGYDTYEWQDGSSTTDYTLSYPATRQYALTVTDSYGCEGSDNLMVYTYNVEPNDLISPVSQCILSNSETVTLSVINSSQDTLLKDEVINVSYVLNSGSPINESFALADSLKPGETVNYTFTQTADLSANQTHQFDLSAVLDNIDVETNDEITRQVDYQTPVFDLGDPVTEGGTEYTIHAGPDYINYKWFDGTESAADSTYTVDINDQQPNNYYAVTVTTADGCDVSDSIKVSFTTTADLSVTDIFSPTESKCWNSAEEDSVHIEITNVGVVNLNPGTSFTVGYLVNDGNKVTETFNLSTAMNANATREHVFTKFTYSSAGNYKFKPFVKLSGDGDDSNDTLTTTNTISISQPEVDFVGQSDSVYFDEGESYTIQLNGVYLAYEWSTGETTEKITVTNEGAYTVTVTDQYNCQAEGTFYCFLNTTGIDNIIKGNGYSVSYYPNPATDKVLVQFNNSKSTDVTIEVISINGQVIFNKKLKDIKNSLEQIDVNSYANGIYYLRFRINGNVYTRKLVIQ